MRFIHEINVLTFNKILETEQIISIFAVMFHLCLYFFNLLPL